MKINELSLLCIYVSVKVIASKEKLWCLCISQPILTTHRFALIHTKGIITQVNSNEVFLSGHNYGEEMSKINLGEGRLEPVIICLPDLRLTTAWRIKFKQFHLHHYFNMHIRLSFLPSVCPSQTNFVQSKNVIKKVVTYAHISDENI